MLRSLKHLAAIGSLAVFSSSTLASVEVSQVAEDYAKLAHAVFSDSLAQAQQLHQSIENFLQSPSPETLKSARQAWLKARIPYQQSEVFRFGNPVVDNWEGQLNAWPLDEGLIDYVHDSYQAEMGNIGAQLNIVATPIIDLGDATIDATDITPELLADLNELGGSEANVATGYHAIEFLLWGQDLNGTNPGAGNRPHTDYMVGEDCTHGNCERRADYLRAASQLLVEDLTYMEAQWRKGGEYRQQLGQVGDKEVFTRALYGMGSLSLGELAGERMKVALEAHSPEDEHDCFSDNTHNSHFYNALGIRNVYLGQYQPLTGQPLALTSMSELVKQKNPNLDQQMTQALDNTQAALQVLVDSAESGAAAFDQLIAEGNDQGRDIIIRAINALVIQTQLLEEVATTLGIDNLNPDTADHDF